jgi:hypothetical protein
MSLIGVILTLVIVGVILWLINAYIPMAGSIKTILNVVVVVAVVIWLLRATGVWGGVAHAG